MSNRKRGVNTYGGNAAAIGGGGGGLWSVGAETTVSVETASVSLTGLTGTRFKVIIDLNTASFSGYYWIRLNGTSTITEYPLNYGKYTYNGGANYNAVWKNSGTAGILPMMLNAIPLSTMLQVSSDIYCDSANTYGHAFTNCGVFGAAQLSNLNYSVQTLLKPALIGAVTSVQVGCSVALGIPVGTHIRIEQA